MMNIMDDECKNKGIENIEASNYVLHITYKLSLKILVLVEQDSSHNGPLFLGGFMEALHYYSEIFDTKCT